MFVIFIFSLLLLFVSEVCVCVVCVRAQWFSYALSAEYKMIVWVFVTVDEIL